MSRWFDPSLGRFTSPDTIVPTSTQGTQAWDRYAFVNNNPVRYNDPTGHSVSAGDVDHNRHDPNDPCAEKGYDSPEWRQYLNLPEPPTPVCSSSMCSGNPTLNAPTTIELAVAYFPASPIGAESLKYLQGKGYTINYNTVNCNGQGGSNILVPPPTCAKSSPTYIAGTIAHEISHEIIPGDSLWEEYQANLIGDVVRNDLIQAGYGSSSDMKFPLSWYTVNMNNPNRNQLGSDLKDWFYLVGLKVYIETYHLPVFP